MQRSRSSRITAKSLSPGAGPRVARLDGEFHGAKVMMLDDFVRRHAADERSGSPPPRSGSGDAARQRPRFARCRSRHRGKTTCSAPSTRRTTRGSIRHLEFVPLPCGKVLGEAGSIPEYVYFPTAGIVSMLYEMKNGTSVEAAITGHDGVIGVTVYMGGGATTSRAVVRNSGHGYRMRADLLKREFEESPTLRQPLLRYAQALLIQMAQSGICHGHHQLIEQFCRPAAEQHGPAGARTTSLSRRTRSPISLGVRRESITAAAAGKLQAAGLIQYRRGRITVLEPVGAGIEGVRVLRHGEDGARAPGSAPRADAGRCVRRCGVTQSSPTAPWWQPRMPPPSIFARHRPSAPTPRDERSERGHRSI